MENIPTHTKGVIVSEDRTVSYGDFKLRAIGENDILVKVHSGVINPSDLMFVDGHYSAKKNFPFIPGFEGSGVVVAGGSSVKSQSLVGKNICFLSSGEDDAGSYSEFTVLDNNSAFELPSTLSLQEGATCLINPLTVEGFIHESHLKGYKTIIHSAAASALGKMLVHATKDNSINLINLVRSEEQVAALKELGAEHIINTSV